jgi:hypothetical protein
LPGTHGTLLLLLVSSATTSSSTPPSSTALIMRLLLWWLRHSKLLALYCCVYFDFCRSNNAESCLCSTARDEKPTERKFLVEQTVCKAELGLARLRCRLSFLAADMMTRGSFASFASNFQQASYLLLLLHLAPTLS